MILGRDPRASGCMIREGVVSGLLACGHEVVDLGMVSSPVIQHAIRRYDAAGGISISASHNTAEWNALEFFGTRGHISLHRGIERTARHLSSAKVPASWTGEASASCGTIRVPSIRISDELAAVFDFDRLKRLKVVVDCCNGTSSLILRRMNERFGFQFILINERLDGKHFAHDPVISADTDRAAAGSADAAARRRCRLPVRCRFGPRRCRDREGVAVSEEMMLPLIADYLLPRSPGKLVITNLSSSALLEHIAAPHGGKVVRVPVGRQATIDALAGYRSEQIAIAGEGTGAVMMPQFEFVYDGIASMLAILSLIAERGQGLGEIMAGVSPLLHEEGRGSADVAADSRAADETPQAVCGRRDQRTGRFARRLAGPLVPCARQPDRADSARDLRAERRTARRLV